MDWTPAENPEADRERDDILQAQLRMAESFWDATESGRYKTVFGYRSMQQPEQVKLEKEAYLQRFVDRRSVYRPGRATIASYSKKQ